MPRSENQKLKLLYLIKILSDNTDENHGITIQDIIDKLSAYDIAAERKSLYSDITLLTDYGYDIVSIKEGKSYIYKLVSRDFELAELKLLVDSVQSSKFITEKKSNELIKKLESLASHFDASSLHRQVYVANRKKTSNESIFNNVDIIQEAIATNRKISYLYFNYDINKEKIFRHEGKRYVISPWALTWDDENYYMVGYDEEGSSIKHYRVDKMMKICVTDEARVGKEFFDKFDMAVYSNKVFGMFGGREEVVSLYCHNSMAGVIIDRFGEDITMIKRDEEHFTVRVNVMLSPQFYAWVFSLENKVKIIGPDTVIEDMKNKLSDTLKGYEND